LEDIATFLEDAGAFLEDIRRASIRSGLAAMRGSFSGGKKGDDLLSESKSSPFL
jgi:hypothetical protein